MKNITTVALCAQEIRKELKKAFPNIKFNVRSENYAGGNSITIKYIDGIAPFKVEELVSKYKIGSFDGMQDLYEFTNKRDDIPQTKYIFVERKLSESVNKSLMKELCKKYNLEGNEDLGKNFVFNGDWVNFDQLIWREYRNIDILNQ